MVQGRRVEIDPKEFGNLWADSSLSIPDIAAYFNCSGSTITKRAQELSMPRRPAGRRDGQSKTIDVSKLHRKGDGLFGGQWVRDPQRGVMVWDGPIPD